MKKNTLPDFEKNHTRSTKRCLNWLSLCLIFLFGSASYAQVSAYLFEQSTGTYQSIAADGVLVPGTDATATTTYDTSSWEVALPFTFTFNAIDYTSIFVNSNGGATFGLTSSVSSVISSTTAFEGSIGVMNRDLWGVFVTSGITTSGSNTITDVASFRGIAIGKSLRTGSGVPAGTTITAFNEVAGTITMSTNATSSSATASIGWGSGSIFTKVEGIAPNRIFTIQWEGYNDYGTTSTSSNYLTFQLKLSETLNTVETVYGDFFNTSTTSRTNQIGLRGATNADFNNRVGAVGNSWNATGQGVTNSASVSRDNLNNPASGLTFKWTPSICLPATDLTATAITLNSATLGWTSSGTSFELQWGPEGFILGSGTIVPNVAAPYVLNGLMSSTPYSFYIRQNCGATDGFSNWAGPFNFVTVCEAQTSFFENFDSTETGSSAPMPLCWSKAGNGSTYPTTASVAPNSAPNRLYMLANGTATTPTEVFAITPILSNLQTGTHRLKFKAYATAANRTMEIGYFTDLADLSSFVTVEVIQLPGTTQATTQEFTVEPTSVPAGVTNLVFRNNAPTASTTVYIDDVAWEPIPSCPDITVISLQAFGSTSATIGWETGGSETAWEYVYGESTVTDPTTLTPVAVSNNPLAMLSGLTPATTYKIWIRSNCGNGALGVFPQNPFTFTTSCAAVATFDENFDSYTLTGAANPLPNCWTRLGNTGSSYITTGSNDPLTAPNRLYLSASATTPTNAVAVMPPVSNLQAETHRLKFKGYCTTAGKSLEVGYYELDANVLNFIVLETFAMPSTALATATEFIYTPEFVPAGIESLAFRINGGAFTGTTTMYVDDVVWEVIPSCPDIIEIAIASISATTVDIAWTPGGSETAWKYVYAESSVTDPTTLTPVDVQNNPFLTLTDLTPNTNYNLWIRSNCGTGSLGNWSNVQTFTTLCVPVTSFFENFDSYALTGAANPLPNCWVRAGNGSTYITTGGVLPNSPPNRLYMSANGTLTTPTESIAIMPQVSNLAAGTHRLKFRAYASAANKTVEIGYLLDPTDLTTYVPLQTINLTTTSGATAVIYTFIPSGVPDGVIAFAFKNAGLPASTTLYIDDVAWEPIPLCPDVNTVSYLSSTATTASVSWIPGGSETTWEYVYGLETETDPTTLTPIEVSGTPQTVITGLLPATNYQVWVRSKCGTDLGAFSVATSFVTACEPVTVFSENFDTSATGSANPLPSCWSRAGNGSAYVTTGGTTPGTAPNRLYIFASGLTPTQAYAIMPPVSNLQADTHRLKFKAYATTANKYVEIGYFTNPSDLSTFTLLETINLPGTTASTAQTFTFESSIIPAGVFSLVFRNAGTPTSSTAMYIDDVVWEEKPSIVPVCTSNVTATPSSTCGNFPTAISWNANPETDGYYLTIGTTAGGTDVLNSLDVGLVTSYNFVGNLNTNYFYTVTPYNSAGPAVGCIEQSFMTAVNGCYCTSVPTSNDSLGVTNVQLGTVDFPNGDVTYFDYTATTVDLAQGVPTNLQVTLSTGYTYNTNVWIDLNDNYTFESNELFFQGEAPSATPTVQDASFLMPVNAALGLHRMRIVTTDVLQVPANPCYSGTYGVTLDFTVNVIALPSCLAPLGLSVDDTSLTATDVTANWTASTTPATEGYDYYYSTSSTFPTETTAPSGTVAAGITTVSLTDLTPATTYYVWVRSKCSLTDTSVWSASVSFTTLCANFDTPFTQDFATYLPNCWATADAGTVATGPTGTAEGIWTEDGFLNVGDTGAVKVNLYGTNRVGWLITPPMNTTVGSEYTFSFNYGVTVWNQTGPIAMGSDDFVKVVMSTDDGTTWSELQSFTAASNVSNTSQTYDYDFVASTSVIKFALLASDGTVNDLEDYDFFIDNISLDVDLSNVNFENNKFTAYPNPVKNDLTIRYNENIFNVTVFNLLGQQLFVKTINTTEGKVDMSNLSAGTYLIKVTSGDKAQTIKVIKE